ncbi:non-ribosomal peptide synthetase, partial [Streptomyces noursei]|uniref:non-ribosomal peptide synthetase n=1 Tax=Streptomyces noursei TaxID=1971 RepID=UPI001F46534B
MPAGTAAPAAPARPAAYVLGAPEATPPTTRHPLSRGQYALWVVEQLADGAGAYNLPLASWLAPDVDVTALRTALQSLLDRHPQLRATVRTEDGEPFLSVDGWQELSFVQRYLTVTDDAVVLERLREEVRRPFDLARGPLLRATLHSLADGRRALLLVFHHLVFDGVSIGVFLRELEDAYRAAAQGRAPSATAPSATYADFTTRQHALLAGPEGERLRAYWTRRLHGELPVLQLPLDRPRPAVPSYRGASVEGRIDAALTDAAKRLARTQRVSLYVVLVAAYVALLHRHSAQRRILVGTPTTGRPADGFDDVLGYFMNMVVLDQEVAPDAAFTALLGQVSRTVSEALEHSAYPLIDVARALQEDGRGTAGPLFQAAFYFQNWLDRGRAQDGLVRGMVDGVHQEGEFDVTLEVIEERDGCRYTVKYNPDLFDEDTVQRLGAGFVRLLDALVAAPDRPVGTADLLAPEERRALHEEWNATRQDYPRDRLVCELVDEQAAARPDAVAVVCGAQRLTYRELADRVDRLAGHLRARGAAPGRTVGVLMERSADLLVALLAVLKAGGAYVPLDPSYPTARLAHMAADARLHLLVAHSSTEHLLAGAVPETVVLDRDHALIAASPGAGPVPGATAEDTAYVLYTSGSTGEPKGVEVGHRALVNFLVSMAREPGLGPDDRLLALTTVCFDIAGLELYGPLITGGRVEILPTEDARDGVRLRAALEAARPTVVQATPATWKMLLAAGWPGDPALKVLCGGEALDQDTADRLTAGCGQVWNLFGPTETTIWSAADRLLPGAPVTIGRPLANTQLYVLDEHRTPLPVGVPGELYIGGDGLARGYLGRPELTRERFVANPLADGPSPRLYRTGDLVRRLPDGRIGYLGRIDSQVKVRGFRVELTEIEATLRRLPGVREAVVVAREVTPGNVGLRAFYLGTDSTEGAAAVDKDALRAWLPEYMVPDVLVRLRSFPQTLNGKVDRTALAARELAALRAAHGAGDAEPAAPAAPQGRTGHQDRLHAELAAMVGELVNLPAEAVPSDAPLGELGMNSVTFTALSTALQRRFGIPANPTLFYQYPTLTTLVPHLHGAHPQRLAAAYGAPAPAALTGDRAAQLPAPAVAPAPADGPHPAGDADVAIIGMAGRFPSSVDLDAFWDHLVSGRDLIQEIPADRWDWRDYAEDAPADPDAPRAGRAGGGTSRSRWGGFLPDVDRFDAAFFGISPREAELMDPQQRLVLEAVWTAVEDAGYRPGDLAGRRVGVFLGVTNSDYPEVQRAAGRGIEGHTVTGSALSVIPNRVSYLLDLRGPSVAMDTACSSSLTAVEQAVTALHEGSCDLALAGGVNLILSPALYVALSRGEMLSEDGRCKAFDSRANGYVRGEGVGVVLLKPRVAAERDDDPVHAVIKAVEVGHGGRTNSLTSPNPNAQADLVLAAHRRAGTDPATVGYLEAHGTGTALGDPIEIAGLKDAFVALHRDAGTPVPDRPTCLVGSVKTNIGHLEGAAGIAGLIKTVLAMRHAEIPATLHYERRNPYVDFTGTPFEVVDRTRPWPAPQGPDGRALPRRAGVSSFGFGGATAHVVLEEAVRPRRDAAAPHGTLVFPLSARTAEALAETADRLARFLHAGAVALPDVAHTLQVGREAFEERLAIVTDDRAALLAALAAAARDTAHPAAVRGRVPAGRP